MALTPEEQAELASLEGDLGTAKSAVSGASQQDRGIVPPGVQDFFTEPAKTDGFSMGEVGASAVAGGAIGAALGSPGGPVGAALGGAGGAIMGGIGSIAGQFAKSLGASEAGALGVELATGGLGGAGKMAVSKTADILTGVAPYKFRAALRALGGGDTPRELATQKVVGEALGKAPQARYAFTPNQDKLNNTLTSYLADQGVPTYANMNVPEYLKGQVFDATKTLRNQGDNFRNAPEFKDLLGDIDNLSGRAIGGNFKEDKATIVKAASALRSAKPEIRDAAVQDILNIIQHGGKYNMKDGTVSNLISPEAQQALQQRFGQYLERNLGQNPYSDWNEVLTAFHTARSVDEIPIVLNQGLPKRALQDFSMNLKRSPDGLKQFGVAVKNHLGSMDVAGLPPKEVSAKLLNEWNKKIAPVVNETGLMSKAQIDGITDTIQNLPRSIDAETKKAILMRIIQPALVSAGGAEMGNTNMERP